MTRWGKRHQFSINSEEEESLLASGAEDTKKKSRREEAKKIKMTTRTILGNIQNVSQARPSQQGGKILQVANWLTGKAGNNVPSGKENILHNL